MSKLNREMDCIGQTAAISHREKFVSIDESLRHFAAQLFNFVGVFFEELLFHFHAFAAFAQNLVPETLSRLVDHCRVHNATASSCFSRCRPYAYYAAQAPSAETM